MKVPTKVVFSFDPDTHEDPVFQHKLGKILWACIKHRHLADQYFNENVFDTAILIEESDPHNYEEFKNIINRSKLNRFGTYCKKAVLYSYVAGLDDEFWGGIWDYLSGEKELEIEIEE